MPSNEKRRDVAAKLYEMIVSTNPTWPALMEVMGKRTRSGALMEIVHLIEPEERTCRNVGGDEWGFKCSECGGHTHGEPFHVPDEERKTLAEMLGGRIVSLHGSVPRFCPNCGAKVIHDA